MINTIRSMNNEYIFIGKNNTNRNKFGTKMMVQLSTGHVAKMVKRIESVQPVYIGRVKSPMMLLSLPPVIN